MGTLSLANGGFFFGAVGQMLFYGNLFPRISPWLLAVLTLVPWFTVYTATFCKQPLFGPRSMRHCLIFVMAWYLGVALLAEVLTLVLSPLPPEHFSLNVARGIIYLPGSVSIFVFVRACIVLRQIETRRPTGTATSQ